MKKLFAVIILLCMFSTQAMAELKLVDRAMIANCHEFASLRTEPSTSAKRLSKIKLD